MFSHKLQVKLEKETRRIEKERLRAMERQAKLEKLKAGLVGQLESSQGQEQQSNLGRASTPMAQDALAQHKVKRLRSPVCWVSSQNHVFFYSYLHDHEKEKKFLSGSREFTQCFPHLSHPDLLAIGDPISMEQRFWMHLSQIILILHNNSKSITITRYSINKITKHSIACKAKFKDLP